MADAYRGGRERIDGREDALREAPPAVRPASLFGKRNERGARHCGDVRRARDSKQEPMVSK
jgi:hypothetical protein